MKLLIRYLAVVLFLAYSFDSFCQNNLINDEAKWYYNIQFMLTYQYHTYYLFEVIRDTIIEDESAKLIQKSHPITNDNFEIDGFVILLEKDKKVYHWEDDKFRLMYDFSLNVSDTFKTEVINYSCDSISPIIVDSVKTIEIDTSKIKSIYLSYTLYIKDEYGGSAEKIKENIIERIGNEEDFIYRPGCAISDEFTNSSLRCFIDPVIGTYKGFVWQMMYPTVECDSIINESTDGLSELDIGASIKLYPNPAKFILNIEVNTSESIDFQIFNILGELILESQMSENVTINLSRFEEGLYIIKFIRDDNIIVKKLQIIR